MNKRIIFIISFSICITNLIAQEVKICIQTGYGFYNMCTLSSITNDALHQLPFEAKIISNYPPYYYYQPMVKLSFKNLELGFAYTFQITGSKISSKDYSGEYKFGTSINGNSLGIIFGSVPRDSGKFHIGYFLQMGVNLSTFKTNEFLQIETIINNTDYKFTTNSFYFEPGVKFTYCFNNRLSIDANVAYYKEFFRKDLEGENTNNIPVKKDFGDSDMWDGFRLGITLSYVLFK